MSDQDITLAGRYRLGRQIGNGGMADVYLGEDTRLHRTVAVKILRSELARDSNFQERFRREAQSAAGLNHPSIVAVYDTGEESTKDPLGADLTLPFIVMEYVKGKTLRELIDPDEPLEIAKANVIMGSLLSALQYSHEMGIVHRDIKPGNVMITTGGAVKVMDFGIARAVADSTSRMTQTQAVMGTAQYLSPEQARGQVVDARSDIYSAACVMYELLTGRPPFLGDSPVSIAYQHVREQPVPPSRFNPEIGPELDSVILTGLAKDRDERYPTAQAFSQDISAVARGQQPALVAGGAALVDPDSTAAMAPVDEADATQALSAQGEPATEVLGPHQMTQAHTPVGAAAAGAGAAGAALGASSGDPAAAQHAEPAQEPEKKKRSAVPVIILVVLALLALAAALLWFLRPWDTAPEQVTVPNVVGQTEQEARTQLTDAGLEPSFSPASSDTVPEGQVISTDPASGASVDAGSPVAVAISSGPGQVDVPDLTGMTRAEAEAALQEQGLTLAIAGEEDAPDAEEGTVVRSEPGAGSKVGAGSEVSVYLATGLVEVPNVVGLDREAAITLLENQGFGVDVAERPDGSASPGTVIEQTPSNGEKVKPEARISVIVAGEPQPQTVTVPNVTGQPAEQAQQALSDAGFGVRSSSESSADVPEGNVIRTDPAANSDIAEGSDVTLIVSTGPEAAPSPTETPTQSPPESSPPAEQAPPSEPGNNQGNNQGGNAPGSNNGGNAPGGNNGGNASGSNNGGN